MTILLESFFQIPQAPYTKHRTNEQVPAMSGKKTSLRSVVLLYGTSKHKISTGRADKGHFHMEKLGHKEWHSHEPVPIVQYGLCSLYVGDMYPLASTDGNIDFCRFSVQSSGMAFWGKYAKPPSGFGIA